MFSNYSGIKLEIDNKKIVGKSPFPINLEIKQHPSK